MAHTWKYLESALMLGKEKNKSLVGPPGPQIPGALCYIAFVRIFCAGLHEKKFHMF